MTKETIQKIRIARARQLPPRRKGFKMSEEHKRKIGLANSISLKGKRHSQEWKNNMSKIMKELGNKPPSFKGRKHTEEAKKKMSLINMGKKRPCSEERKRKLSETLKGKMPKNIDLIRSWNKGKVGTRKGVKLSEETKRKMRISAIKKRGLILKRDTSIELKMEKLLIKLGIEFQKQVPLHKIAIVDFYVPSKNLVIQVDGCYWHGCPIHHPTRMKSRERDANQDKVLQENGLQVIRFWEHEIMSPNFIIKDLELSI